ncbi:uncharacterized protein LOC113867224 isoform X1 [Abrus precatorius]|uniref:Uncharacterized protein LOC113867224 isoform X1 n=1 Tax=Abrus precatorius TaxID=3816 RepID=A0A8B8LQR0_ABRPR|nr:uncharacterized protein LOC113867224 isoform X1 [Abrus precatorius]
MTNYLGLRLLNTRVAVSGGVCWCCPTRVVGSSGARAKWKWRIKGPRRMVLGLGASFLSQFMTMSGNNSFIASARITGGPSVDEVISFGVVVVVAKLLNAAISVVLVFLIPILQILKNVEWPEQFPFKDEDFQRFDESSDSLFYETPRFVTHIDDPAIAALTKYYSKVFPPSNTPGVSILDMCSSWVSHFPSGYKQDRVVGLGMNEEELKRNPVLTEYVVQDLNVNPKLPFEDNSFDIITNVVSVDYLTKPLDVFKEMCRILKPGGLAIMSFSNRCFWTKAISIWTSTGDADHVMIVGSYFHYAGGFEPPQAVDISPNPGRSDPMYIVYSRKLSTA